MSQIYRLISGKITRLNDKGEMETHKAPYEFVPTESEYAANKFRMQQVSVTLPADNRKITVETAAVETAATESIGTAVPVDIPVAAVQSADIRQMSAQVAVSFVDTAVTEDELDAFLLQESDNRPRPRRRVIEAIELRRKAVRGEFDKDFMQKQLAASESAPE